MRLDLGFVLGFVDRFGLVGLGLISGFRVSNLVLGFRAEKIQNI